MAAGRQGDVKMVVVQDNDSRKITIESIDESTGSIEQMIHYKAADLIGKDIRDYLTPRIREIIEDYVEFDDFGPDLNEVLKKTKDFAFISSFDAIVEMNMSIIQDVCYDKNSRFLIIMQARQDACISALEEIKEQETLDPETHLPDRESILAKLEVIHDFIEKGKTTGSFAVMSIDGFSQHVMSMSADRSDILLREIVERCRKAFRSVDILGYLGNGKFCVGLLRANLENAKIPLDRLRNIVAENPVSIGDAGETRATLSIAYKEIKKDSTPDLTIKMCEDKIKQNESGSNQLLPL